MVPEVENERQVPDLHEILDPMAGESGWVCFPKTGCHFCPLFLQKWTEKLGGNFLFEENLFSIYFDKNLAIKKF
jgi:hypothetical protein